MKKRLIGKIAAGLTVFTALCIPVKSSNVHAVYAEDVQFPSETNTSFSKARNLEFGSSMAGTFSESDGIRYYKFSFAQAGKLDLGAEMQANNDLHIKIYDSSQTEIYDFFHSGRYVGTGPSFSVDAVYLTGGDYYMVLECYENISVSFLANMDPMGESFTETQDSNNDISSDASSISLKNKYKGILAQNDDIDYYSFNVPASGLITLNLTNSTSNTIKYTVYDQSMNPAYTNTAGKGSKISQPVSVKSGDYYLAIAKEDVNKGTGSYTFFIDHTKKNASAPKIKSVKNTSGGTMTVKWSQVNGAGGYELWYSTKSNFKSGVTKKETDASVTSTDCYGLSRNKKYYIRIRAYSEVNGIKEYGKWSSRKSVVIKR